MDKITADIKNGKTENIYLFYGEDAYKRRVYKNFLKKALYSNEMNFSCYEGSSINWKSVYDACVDVPFFAEKRLVIVENSGIFKAKAAGRGQKGADEDILNIFKVLPKSTCLAFFEEEAAKSKKLYKEILKKGAVCECAHDSMQTVCAWLEKGFAQAKKRVKKDAVYAIVERTGVDYERVKAEFEKVISYAAGSDIITAEDVRAVCGESIEGKTYEIINACSQKNAPLMLEKYYALVENEIHPLIILASLRSQFELMLQIAELCNQGLSDREAAKQLGKAEFIIKNTKKTIYNFRINEIINIIEKITLTDKQIKNGDADERTGVEILLAEIGT